MRRMIVAILCLCLLTSVACADAYVPRPGLVTVVAQEPVPLRSEPAETAEAALQIAGGVTLTLLSVDADGWAYVQLDAIRDGELPRGYVRTESLMYGDYLHGEILRVVNPVRGERLNLRSAPSVDAPSMGKYYTGVLVGNYQQDANGFLRVFVGDQVGYMDGRYLMTHNATWVSDMPITTIQNKTGSGANMRKEPSLDGELFANYPNGTEVVVLGVTPGDWCHVMINGATGFVRADLLAQELHFAAPEAGESASEVLVVANPDPADRLNLRAEPSETSESLGKFHNGTKVNVLEVSPLDAKWVYVQITDQLFGWMDATYLALVADEAPQMMIAMDNNPGLFASPDRFGERISGVGGAPTVYVYGILSNGMAYVSCEGMFGYMVLDSLTEDLHYHTNEAGPG